MQILKNLSRTLFLSMFLLTMMTVFLFPGRIHASKYSVPIDPLSESGERTGKRLWKPRPQLASNGGLSETADWSAGSDQAGAAFGFSVGTAGDYLAKPPRSRVAKERRRSTSLLIERSEKGC